MQLLKLFRSVALHQSISKAAVRYGVTQSAVSQRIRQLEQKLGVQLLDRSVRPLKLTAAGQVFLEGCNQLLEDYERLEQRVSGCHQLEGTLCVEAIYSAGIDLLSQVKSNFKLLHPNVEIIIEYKHPQHVANAVREGRCHLGIVSYPDRWAHVSFIPLREERMGVVCRPGHPLTEKTYVRPTQLNNHDMVAFESSLPVAQHIRKYLRKHDVNPSIDNVFDNIDTIKNAVAVTDHISILPIRMARREVTTGQLSVIPLEPELLRPIGIIHRRHHHGHGFAPLTQAFVDFLIKDSGPDGGIASQAELETSSDLAGVKV
ncbi:MAG: hypothetical protein CMJ20_03775 [Phycisphaeraceae bacterium]|nr:hypothetical protein [Phycisphaeraceae bacterium]